MAADFLSESIFLRTLLVEKLAGIIFSVSPRPAVFFFFCSSNAKSKPCIYHKISYFFALPKTYFNRKQGLTHSQSLRGKGTPLEKKTSFPKIPYHTQFLEVEGKKQQK